MLNPYREALGPEKKSKPWLFPTPVLLTFTSKLASLEVFSALYHKLDPKRVMLILENGVPFKML